jgi:glycosyltransferase involved in cell wall biosynthesis
MKLLIDAQCVRELKPHTGTERYSIELSKAIVRQGGDHELWITTGPHATDAVEAIFGRWVPRARMVRIALPAPMPESTPADTQRALVAEWIREAFIADLAPDLVHLTSLVWHPAVTSIHAFERGPKISVSHYDLIPLLNPDRYLRDITTRET